MFEALRYLFRLGQVAKSSYNEAKNKPVTIADIEREAERRSYSEFNEHLEGFVERAKEGPNNIMSERARQALLHYSKNKTPLPDDVKNELRGVIKEYYLDAIPKHLAKG